MQSKTRNSINSNHLQLGLVSFASAPLKIDGGCRWTWTFQERVMQGGQGTVDPRHP